MSPIKLNGSTSGFVALDAPAAAGSNTLVLPTGNGSSGQVLSTNGSGSLSWSTVTSSKILQVVTTAKTNTFSTTSTSFADVTGLSVSITPSSASNTILVIAFISGTATYGTNNTSFRLVRGSTAICIGDSGGGSRIQASGGVPTQDGNSNSSLTISFLDSPATTSSTTYKIQQIVPSGTGYVNRTTSDTDATYTARTASTITVMEVAA